MMIVRFNNKFSFFQFLLRSTGDQFCSIAAKLSPALSALISCKAFVIKASESYFSTRIGKKKKLFTTRQSPLTNIGMTLIEIMVAMAILGFIMLLVWSSTSQSLRSKERTEARDQIFHSGRVVMNKLLDDLSMSFLTPSASGVPGQEEKLMTYFIGKDNGEQDSIKFTSFSHLRLFANGKESDQCQVLYAMERTTNEDEKGFKLMRSEIPWLDYKSEIETKSYELAYNVKSFELEYYDTRKDEWVKEWDTSKIDWKERLPRAVKVTINFFDPAGDDEETLAMSSAVLLPLSNNLVEF